MQRQETQQKSVIIIGAGLSGLTAANDILSGNQKIKVTVLEAMDRVGGRTCSTKVEGVYYDFGAEWIGPTQFYATELAIKSGSTLVHQFCQGTKIMQFGKSIQTYRSDIPTNVGYIGLIHMQYNMWKLDRMARSVPNLDPTACPQAIIWDSMTVDSWVKANIWTVKIRILLEAACRAVFGAQTTEISLLFFLWYINQSGGIQNVINIKNGLQQKKLSTGTQHMSNYLSQQIQKKGGKVILNSWVASVQSLENKVIVKTSIRKYQADYLIVALPPCNVTKINFQPALSKQRQFICNRNLLGSSTKVILLYDKCYWKEKGFSGEILSDCFDSPIFNGYDDSRTKDNGEIQPGLVIFINGSVSRLWMSRDDWKNVLLERLAQYYGQEMLKPLKMQWKIWQDQPSICGSPIAFYGPGALTQIKNLREPEGRIHWAGTEMATVSQGYMDGAIQSGKRVAQDILSEIRGKQKYEKIDKVVQEDFWYNKIVRAKSKFFQWW